MNFTNTLAVIFDFDDTLTEDSTSALLEKHGIDAERFWKSDVDKLVTNEGWEPTCAYLHLLLKYIELGKMPPLTRKDLQDFGATLQPFPGLEGLLPDLRRIAKEELFEIEFYIISGGLADVIEGFRLRSEFKHVWGCELAPETPGGPLKYVKRTITFTEKTRYLFEINKGLDPADVTKNPYLVNRDVPADRRRVPFSNMIYIGDGLSDIPCFSLIKKRPDGDRGFSFGIFNPEKSARKAWKELIATERVMSAHTPKYGEHDDLGSLLRVVVVSQCVDIKLRRE